MRTAAVDRRRGGATAVAAGALVIMAAACSSSGSGGIKPIGADSTRPTSSGSPSSLTATTTTSTTDPTAAERQAVLDTYNASWAAVVAIGADPKGNPDDPVLAQSTADPLLAVLRLNLAGLRRNHLTEVGPYTLNPVIVNLTPTSAVVQDCIHDATDQVNVVTGVHTPPRYPYSLSESTVALTPAGWRVTVRYPKANTCTP